MSTKKRTALTAIAAVVVLGATAAGIPGASAAPPADPTPGVDRFPVISSGGAAIVGIPPGLAAHSEITAMVQFRAAPAVERVNDAAAKGKSLDLKSAAAAARADRSSAEKAVRKLAPNVLGSTDTVVNTITVRATPAVLRSIAATPGVARVQASRVFHKSNAVSDQFTGVPSAWKYAGATGAGIKVAVIDDGIDYTHANFGGPGTAAAFGSNNSTTIEPGTFPTAKVVGGYDFVGDNYDASADQPGETTTPSPDPDPLPCGEHGSHVAGSVAGFGVTAAGAMYTGTYDDTTLANQFSVPPGAAPKATLLAYKVFGCDGSVDDFIIVAAIDRAVTDGANVINMSLGAPFGNAENVEAMAIDNAVNANVLVVAAAGNEGPNAYMTGSPATSNKALSVAAVDVAYSTLPTFKITLASGAPIAAQNSNGAAVPGPITGELVNLGLGCAADDAAAAPIYAAAAGKIAVTTRGTCARVDRARWGQAAGALAVIMINDSPGLPPVEGPIAGVTIPFLGASQADGARLTAGGTATIAMGDPIPNPSYKRFASFTSNGLRYGDSALKPDIAAPGVAILSTFAGTGNQGVRISGTSMASPHTAGIAALVRQTHPTLTPIAIKGILMGTAAAEDIGNYTPRRGGAGLVRADLAVDARAFPWTDDGKNNLSFGFDELTTATHSETLSFNITNTSATAVTYDLSVSATSDLGASHLALNPSTITIGAGQTGVVQATLHIDNAAALADAAAADRGALPTIQGRIIASPRSATTGITRLVVPYAQVANVLSNVTAQSAPGSTTTALTLSNNGLVAGTADIYQWTHDDAAGDVVDPLVPDIRNVGVQSFRDDQNPKDALIVFAVNYNNRTSTHATEETDVLIDTGGNAEPDFALVAVDAGLLTTGTPNGLVNAFLINLKTNTVVTQMATSAPANGSVVLIPTMLSALGLQGEGAKFNFAVASYSIMDGSLAPDVTTTKMFRPFKTAVSTGAYVSVPAGGSVNLPVDWTKPEVDNQGALGWLVVTQDDAGGPAEADGIAVRRG